MYKLLAINPGNTSTKIGFFHNKNLIKSITIEHSIGELSKFKNFVDQLDFRLKSIDYFIIKNNIDYSKIDFYIGRGGYLKPLKSGLYEINNKMIRDLTESKYGEHSSNLGAIIVFNYASKYKKKSYILDPVSVDELEPIARISGHPAIERKSVFHALNQKRIARKISFDLGKSYNKANLIIAHLGSGISIGLHHFGKVIDVTHGIDGEGPFTPERSGGLPLGSFIRYIFKNNLKYKESFKMIYGQGGLVAYLGTNDFNKLIKEYKNNNKVKLIIDAMAYQISKYIASMATPVNGNIEGIAITGGLAHSKVFTDKIVSRIRFLTENILIYPGEDELLAMVEGVLQGINKKIEIFKYK